MAIKKAEMESLMKNTLEMVKQGLTTVEELDRVLFETEEFEGAEVLKCERCQKPVEPDWEACRSCGHVRKAPSSDGVEQIRTPAQIATSHIPQSEGYAFQGFKILLVEDDDDMLQRLKFILLEKQFTITTAANGLEALEKIARDKPHLVVTDVMMPRMDGLELIRRLRKDITTTFIPVIILSAKQETADRLKGFAVGTDDYLPKPFSIHELFFRINAILKRVYK
jgi:CheY-like chemotaxis protein